MNDLNWNGPIANRWAWHCYSFFPLVFTLKEQQVWSTQEQPKAVWESTVPLLVIASPSWDAVTVFEHRPEKSDRKVWVSHTDPPSAAAGWVRFSLWWIRLFSIELLPAQLFLSLYLHCDLFLFQEWFSSLILTWVLSFFSGCLSDSLFKSCQE